VNWIIELVKLGIVGLIAGLFALYRAKQEYNDFQLRCQAEFFCMVTATDPSPAPARSRGTTENFAWL